MDSDMSKICKKYRKNNYRLFRNSDQTPEITTALLQQDGLVLRHLNGDNMCEEYCTIAVENTYLALKYVPIAYMVDNDYRNSLFEIALEQSLNAVKFMNSQHIPSKYYEKLVDNGYFSFIDPDELTKDLCYKYLRSGGNLARIPKFLKDKNMCTVAVCHRGTNLAHVPMAWRNFKRCKIALEQNRKAWTHVPDSIKTDLDPLFHYLNEDICDCNITDVVTTTFIVTVLATAVTYFSAIALQ